MFYSITLGGFGVDRFYLGLWKSGIGKLFSFGGFGIWTIIDIVLIGVGYVGPADGSLCFNVQLFHHIFDSFLVEQRTLTWSLHCLQIGHGNADIYHMTVPLLLLQFSLG
uniref:TM2 domain-containing protein n=1 Tax=Ditylenchus dipsaci TaxID=166011 RepID=A0A915DZH5_9BILA